MPETKLVPVKDLLLDLQNFRTVPQKNELEAAQALIGVNLSRFWSLMNSLLATGYLPTENIIVIKQKAQSKFIVKEGNRRTAALKMALGLLPMSDIDAPADTLNKIKDLSDDWMSRNRQIPCVIYDIGDADVVRRIVSLTHGKGEQAGDLHPINTPKYS